MKKSYLRSMAISLFIVAISFFNFSNLSGGECIRAIHIVTLLVCGMGIGIFLMSFFKFLREKRKESEVSDL